MKKQISLLLVALGLSFSNGAQAGFYGPSSKQAIKRATTLLPLCTRADGRLSQETLHAAKKQFGTKTSSFLPKPGTTMPARTYSELLSKPSTITMPIRTFTPSTLGTFDQEQNRSNYGWWQSIKDSPTAKWIAALFAGGATASGIYNVKSVLAEEEIQAKRLGDPKSFGALSAFIWTDNMQRIQELVEQGADINDQNENGKTALMLAAAYGDPSKVKNLIQAGADVNIKDKDGETALMWYLLNKELPNYPPSDPEIVKALIQANADVNTINKDGKTALMIAANREDIIDVVKELIQAKANINAQDKNGKTALMLAAKQGNINTAEELLKAGADVNAKDRFGTTPLMEAVRNGKKHRVDMIRKLIKAKSDVNAQDTYGDTALMLAAHYHDPNAVKELIEAKADVNAQDKDGKTALILAVWRYYPDINIVEKLIKAGADVNAVTKGGKSILMLAKEYGNEKIINILQRSGAKEYPNSLTEWAYKKLGY